MPETLQEAIDKLAALAGPDEIAEWLTRNGYRSTYGTTNDLKDLGKTTSCPIAQYIADKCGWDREHVCAGVDAVMLYNDNTKVDKVSLPQNIRDFVHRYDTEWYPALQSEATNG